MVTIFLRQIDRHIAVFGNIDRETQHFAQQLKCNLLTYPVIFRHQNPTAGKLTNQAVLSLNTGNLFRFSIAS